MKFNPQEINQLMESRRSVFPKDYSGEQVSQDIVRRILENANLAPTHKLTEPWRFVVFTGEGLKKLADFQSSCYREVTTKNVSFKEQRFESLKSKPFESSYVIAVGMKRDPEKRVPEQEEIGAVFCAIENMYLTATAYGIGCYLSTGGITYFEEARAFFGLGQDDKLLGFFHLGVPKSWPAGSVRKPLEEKLKWVES